MNTYTGVLTIAGVVANKGFSFNNLSEFVAFINAQIDAAEAPVVPLVTAIAAARAALIA